MDANGMTLADFAALEKMGNRHRGAAITGLALGAVALGVGVIGTVAVGWGVNAASKARSRAVEQLNAAQALRTNDLFDLVARERSSRESWINRNQPTIGQYVDVQTNPNLSATLMDYIRNEANATATAQAIAQANAPLNAAVGTESFLKVQRYSAPQPCGCDTCGN